MSETTTHRDAPQTPKLAEEPTAEEYQAASTKLVDKMSEQELRREVKQLRRERKDYFGDLAYFTQKNDDKRLLLTQIRRQINRLIGYEEHTQ